MATPDQRDVDAARTALAGVRGDWMAREGVISVEVARAHEVDDPTAVCLRVTVRVGAQAPDFPGDVDGVPVEVVAGYPPAPE